MTTWKYWNGSLAAGLSATVSVPGTNATSNKSVAWLDELVSARAAALLTVTLRSALQESMDMSLVLPMIINFAPTVPLILKLACPLLTLIISTGGMPQKVDWARLV